MKYNLLHKLPLRHGSGCRVWGPKAVGLLGRTINSMKGDVKNMVHTMTKPPSWILYPKPETLNRVF